MSGRKVPLGDRHRTPQRVRSLARAPLISADFPESRLNAGFRVYITPSFNLDVAVRTIGQGGNYTNGNTRGTERVAMFMYTGSF